MESLAEKIRECQEKTKQQDGKYFEKDQNDRFRDVLDNFLSYIDEWVREGIRDVIQRALKEEFDHFIGAERYERTKSRVALRNGYGRQRSILTGFGLIEGIRVPRARDAKFRSKIIPKWKRRQGKISRIITDMFIRGISTRKVKALCRNLWGSGLSASSVSEMNKQMHEELLLWLNRPIKERIAYLILDAVELKVRRTKVSGEALLCAVGITEGGKKVFLGIMLGGKESSESWERFLLSLIDRGLKAEDLKLIVVDGGKGLLKAISEVFPDVKIQRCTVHKMRNVVSRCPVALRGVVSSEAKEIFNSSSKQEALDSFYRWKERWEDKVPKVVELIEKDLDTLLTFYEFPYRRWKKIRTTNIIERCFREFRRRIDSMDSFPNEQSCMRIMFSLARMIDEDWSFKPIKNF
jgi:transposase-like protein